MSARFCPCRPRSENAKKKKKKDFLFSLFFLFRHSLVGAVPRQPTSPAPPVPREDGACGGDRREAPGTPKRKKKKKKKQKIIFLMSFFSFSTVSDDTMMNLFAVTVAMSLLALASAQCADKIKGMPTSNINMAQYKSVCEACQKPDQNTREGECEYCVGMCLHISIGGGNPILCGIKRNAFDKRDTGCDGIINIEGAGTHVKDNTVAGHGMTTKVECLAGNEAACAGNSQSLAVATEGDHTFTGFGPEAQATAAPQPTQGNGNGNPVIINGGGGTQAPAIQGACTGSACAGKPCKVNGVSKFFDKCGVCGGKGECNSASALVGSVSVMVVAAVAMTMF